MGFLQPGYGASLTAEFGKNRIERWVVSPTIVNREIGEKRIFAGNRIIKTQQAEILPDFSLRIAISVCTSGRQPVLEDFAPIWRRPEGVGTKQHARLQTWK